MFLFCLSGRILSMIFIFVKNTVDLAPRLKNRRVLSLYQQHPQNPFRRPIDCLVIIN